MTLQIIVDPDAVESLIGKARQVPIERMDNVKEKINGLNVIIASWEGEAQKAHEDMRVNIFNTLEKTQSLMTEILATLDTSIEKFDEKDVEISLEFERRVFNYLEK
ncbi:hypothetical protein HXA34_01755 [Salipaludibacillus agaradhaerens]|jgi:uncharacterized protein YukE|uniref:WXG100 family type VII secretion target n=1 Tax=Salipaludibacillus agaradhaerens TaxID=76935 RepID=UPI002151C9F1|nr:hypothetical protein [Salipaludibacillus agaradhaerens]MCR6105009.1 hypothetical protein [Salipaludibacillus agaradhaerens]MCR6117054.1 hypothetical protein [Salipaludibacillus agaradhaerens]